MDEFQIRLETYSQPHGEGGLLKVGVRGGATTPAVVKLQIGE